MFCFLLKVEFWKYLLFKKTTTIQPTIYINKKSKDISSLYSILNFQHKNNLNKDFTSSAILYVLIFSTIDPFSQTRSFRYSQIFFSYMLTHFILVLTWLITKLGELDALPAPLLSIFRILKETIFNFFYQKKKLAFVIFYLTFSSEYSSATPMANVSSMLLIMNASFPKLGIVFIQIQIDAHIFRIGDKKEDKKIFYFSKMVFQCLKINSK